MIPPWQILVGRCEEILRCSQDRSFDHCICDPPYDAHTHTSARTTKKDAEDGVHVIDFDPLDGLGWLEEAARVTDRWLIAFCAMEQFGAYRDASEALTAGEHRPDLDWIRSGYWDRPDGTPQISGDRPRQPGEGIAIMHRPGKKRWNGGGKRGQWAFGVARGKRLHPTQKPLGLMMELVRDFTEPGDLVLDPFCGSGTTGEACMRLGRRFVGIEMDEGYARAAQERLQDVEEELRAERGEAIVCSKPRQVGLFK